MALRGGEGVHQSVCLLVCDCGPWEQSGFIHLLRLRLNISVSPRNDDFDLRRAAREKLRAKGREAKGRDMHSHAAVRAEQLA